MQEEVEIYLKACVSVSKCVCVSECVFVCLTPRGLALETCVAGLAVQVVCVLCFCKLEQSF